MAEAAYFDRYNEHETRRTLEQVADEHILSVPLLVERRLAANGVCSVLDIGSGNSTMGAEIARMYPNVQVFAVDYFSDLDRSYVRANDPDNLHFAVSDGNSLPFRVGQFDTVISTWSVSSYYGPDFADLPTTYITEIARVLKPDGIASIRPESILLTGRHPAMLHRVLEDTLSNPAFRDTKKLRRKAQDYLSIIDLGFRVSLREEPHRVRIYGPKNTEYV